MDRKKSNAMSSEKLPFEEAMDKVGFGLYGVSLTAVTSLAMFAYCCVVYGASFIVPTSACELATTPTQQGILVAMPMAGLLLGGTIWSYLADTRGRRAMILISLIGGAVFNAIGTISINWIMLLFFQFFGALFSSGLYAMSMSLLSESVPQSKRNSVVLIVSSVLLISQGMMALLARPIIPLTFSYYLPSLGIYWNSWRLLMLVYSIPHIITAICIYFVQESPKCLFSRGHEDKAMEVLQTIHRVNNWKNENELQVLCLIHDEAPIPLDSLSNEEQLLLFKMPLLKYTVIMISLNIAQQFIAFIVWLPIIADQFIRSIQTGVDSSLTVCQVLRMKSVPDVNAAPCALDETALLIVFGVGLLQAIVNLCLSFMNDLVGRRNMAMIMFVVCGVSGILVNLVPNVIASVALFTVMLVGIVTVGLCATICVDLFPTNLRALIISLTNTVQYISIVASIQILNSMMRYYCDAGFYLFSSLFAFAAIVAFFLPNDRPNESEPKMMGPKPGSFREERRLSILNYM